MRILTVLGSVALAAVLLVPERAHACGGFFCSTAPIDQTGERIIFNLKGNAVEAHVQISYAGDAKSFSWVVPTEALPTLSIASGQLFNVVNFATQPNFRLNWTDNSTCGYGYNGRYAAEDSVFASAGAGGNAPPSAPPVTVVSVSEVGPYDAAILQATEAKALTEWLRDNGYTLTPAGADALIPYVGTDHYFVALKLQQDKGVGDLRPITLSMTGARPCIPIRLTAIASRPNMPITAFVFADARAVPQNYKHVLINETKIDWLQYGSNYDAIATEAVDEAGGQAFLTEFAGKTSGLQLSQQLSGGAWDTAKLSTKTHPVDFVAELLAQGWPRDTFMQSLLRKYIPKPASLSSLTDAQFYNQISQYRSAIDSDPGRAPFDRAGFIAELDTVYLKPLAHAKEIVTSHPYLTRLYTTMSAEEMTVDPEFQFNPDVADVPAQHVATATPLCNIYDPNANQVRIDLADGRSFVLPMRGGPVLEGPSAERIEQMPASGAPVVLRDNSEAIAKVLKARGSVKAGGCSVGGVEGAAVAALVGLIGLIRRRRR